MENRLIKLRTAINKQNLDAILVSSLPNITYLTNYSGFSTVEREAFLFIVAQNKQYIITDGRYSEAVHKTIKNFELVERASAFPFGKILKQLSQKHKIKRLGIEEDNLTVSEHKLLSSCFNDLNHFNITSLRIIKDSGEIKSIEKACKLGDKTFKYILKKIKPGVSEKELAFEIELFIKKHGADISFPPIVAFGKNSSIPHHVPTQNSKLLTSNSIVLLDFGVRLNNYCSDMTRTVFFGKATNKQKKIHQTVLEAQKKAIEHLRQLTSDGGPERSRRNSSEVDPRRIKALSIDKIARDYITSQGYPTIPHSLGHGVGLEVHEAPRLSPKSQPKAGQPLAEKDLLKPGMVFSIEPGIYIKGFGGVRIEDLVVLEKKGVRLLTKSKRGIIEL